MSTCGRRAGRSGGLTKKSIGMTFGTIGALGSGKKKVTTYAEGAGEIEIT